MRKFILLIIISIFLSGCINKQQELVATPSMEIDVNKNYQAVLKTSQGNITIDLNAKKLLSPPTILFLLPKKTFTITPFFIGL